MTNDARKLASSAWSLWPPDPPTTPPREPTPRWKARQAFASQGDRHELLVACPKCEGMALIHSVSDRRGTALRLVCGGCGYSLRREAAMWYGPAIGRARTQCRSCGDWTATTVRSLGRQRLSAFTRVSCDTCWTVSEGVLTWSFGEANDGEAHDPIFGLRLILQAPCCGERLWAANLDQLDSLESLVKTARPTTQRVLPIWMTRRENQAEVLGVIRALKRWAE